jgi:hypothetical protein
MIVSIEIPLYEITGFYDNPKKLIKPPRGIEFMLYSGYPGSPLNGGRSNGKVDDKRFQITEFKDIESKKEENLQNLKRLQDYFIDCIKRVNREGISMQLAYTNYFCIDSEFNDKNAEPIREMLYNGEKAGVMNRFIVANNQIEDWIQSMGASKEQMVYSCTRFYFPDKMLDRDDRLAAYHKAAKDYGIVVLTPPDSNSLDQLARLKKEDLPKIAAVINSPCVEACNSYWHYATHSLWNIVTGADISNPQYAEFLRQYKEIIKRDDNPCSREFDLSTFNEKVNMLLSNGIRILKIARGHSQKILDNLLESLSRGKNEI